MIFIAWANLHAGWLGALAFLALAMAGRLADRATGRVDGHDAPIIPWLGLTALCALVVSINPWGWDLYRSVFHLATGLKSASLWIEYLPPNFGTPSLGDIGMSAIAVLFLLIVVFLARASDRAPRWRWEMVLPVLFFLWEGLKAQRHVLLLVEIAAVPLARDLQSLLPGVLPALDEIFDRFQARQREAGGDAWLALVAALGFAVVVCPGAASRANQGWPYGFARAGDIPARPSGPVQAALHHNRQRRPPCSGPCGPIFA